MTEKSDGAPPSVSSARIRANTRVFLCPSILRTIVSMESAPAAPAIVAAAAAPPPPPPPSALQGKEGVCRVEVARVEFKTTRPWQRTPQTRSTGTCFVISGRRLLTSAHVVRSAVDIRVRQYGSTVRYPAAVTVYAPDVDLALLEIRTGGDGNAQQDEKLREEFFANNENLALRFTDQLPALRESVAVYGYPTGGTTVCITEGIVSRIDLVSASAFNNLLAIQIDAAINVSVSWTACIWQIGSTITGAWL